MKHIASAILLASILIAFPASAQNKETERELYRFCSKFPLNPRCEGKGIPVPLDERIFGEPGACYLQTGRNNQGGKCKVLVKKDILTVYLEDEEAEPVELLDNRLPSLEIKIPFEKVFAQSHQIWNNVHRLEFGYLVEPDSDQGNRTNFVTIFTNEEFANSLSTQLSQTPAATQFVSGSQVNTPSDASSQVQQLLETKQCVRCDLRGADLTGEDLDEANLEGANLEGANLKDTSLEGAYLVSANLNQANLTEADLESSNLSLASLNEAVLEDADLRAVNLQGANLQQANLQGVRLSAPALLQDADLRNANLRDADIQGASLEGANLEGTDLKGADLSDTSVSLKDIPGNYSVGEFLIDWVIVGFPVSDRGTKFYTNLRNVNLRNTNLTEANLEDALTEGADLSNANLSKAKLSDVDLSEANLCGATMSDGSTSNQGCQVDP